MIVVDVNVVAYCFIAGERTAQARELLRRDPDWRLPALWHHEYLNVLATFVRQGDATIDEALGPSHLQREKDRNLHRAIELGHYNEVFAQESRTWVGATPQGPGILERSRNSMTFSIADSR